MTFNVDDKFDIAMARGNQMNIRLSVASMSFKEFGAFCSTPQKGDKHESYFLRGVPGFEEEYTSGTGKSYFNGHFRHDSSIIAADFLIIDADDIEIDPVTMHGMLKERQLIHFLYTTHSHNSEKNNYRVVIPCALSCKENLVPTIKALCEDLDIECIKEMGTWSQAWFLPTRQDPADNMFEYYELMEGESYVTPLDRLCNGKNISTNTSGESHDQRNDGELGESNEERNNGKLGEENQGESGQTTGESGVSDTASRGTNEGYQHDDRINETNRITPISGEGNEGSGEGNEASAGNRRTAGLDTSKSKSGRQEIGLDGRGVSNRSGATVSGVTDDISSTGVIDNDENEAAKGHQPKNRLDEQTNRSTNMPNDQANGTRESGARKTTDSGKGDKKNVKQSGQKTQKENGKRSGTSNKKEQGKTSKTIRSNDVGGTGDNNAGGGNSGLVVDGSHQGVDEIINVIVTGAPGLHHAILTYSHMMSEDGIAKKTIIETIRGLMHAIRDRDTRTQERYNDIERIVREPAETDTRITFAHAKPGIGGVHGQAEHSAIDGSSSGSGVQSKKSLAGHKGADSNPKDAPRNHSRDVRPSPCDDEVGPIEKEKEQGGSKAREQLERYNRNMADPEYHKVCWPPGLMGDLAKSVFDFSLYPNRMISIVTALGLVAGVAGRRFNISGSGLNLYMTLLMDTGGGKSVISKFINRVLNDADIFTGANVFTGAGRYTGPKALMDDLYQKRSLVSVFTEAGFMFRSKSGDADGLTRAILDLYGSSGEGCVSAGSSYSSDKNNIKSVVSPCFSMVNESTPDIFLEALKDGSKTGEINRMNIFRVHIDDHKMHRKAKYHISTELAEKIKDLMNRCKKTQENDDPDATVFDVTPKMYDFADQCKLQAIKCKDVDPTRASMLQRSAEKAFKISALLTVLNNRGAKESRKLKIDDDAWIWALKLHDFEMQGLDYFFSASDGGDLHELLLTKVYPVVVKLLEGTYRDKQMQPDRRDRKRNQFPLHMLRRGLRNCKDISALGRNVAGKDGFDVIVKYLTDQGYAKTVRSGQRMSRFVVIDLSFLDLEYDHH